MTVARPQAPRALHIGVDDSILYPDNGSRLARQNDMLDAHIDLLKRVAAGATH